MRHRWLERFLDSIADRGRALARIPRDRTLAALCRALLTGRGEASGTAMSREVLQAYGRMDAGERMRFFQMLEREFSPNREEVRARAEEYLRTGDADAFVALNRAVEPPRQELFRRINMAPGGTAALVAMRAEVLGLLKQHPELKVVETDLAHLLASWFNRGFLTLERIDWHSPADVLERLIRYDTVHQIQGWDDLQRRLAPDRRCFAFFHPALPGVPLIFLEVALVKGMSSEIGPLIDPKAPVLDPRQADSAIFYSINNTQRGLKGLAFGNFLIKQVLEDLGSELPRLRMLATLSPLPGFATALRAARAGEHPVFTAERLERLLAPHREALLKAAGPLIPADALFHLLGHEPLRHRELLSEVLQRLALAYLTLLPTRGAGYDPVASFHLANGARLERINPFADGSAPGWEASFGVKVNYRYDPDTVVENHESFVEEGIIDMSRPLARLQERIASDWQSAAA
jgi:malonyl-CoA decarboxylase